MNNRLIVAAAAAALLLSGTVAMRGAHAAGEDCKLQITKLQSQARQAADPKLRDEALKLLEKANEELVTEADADECLEYVAKAEEVLAAK
jgi:hypothetical protein